MPEFDSRLSKVYDEIFELLEIETKKPKQVITKRLISRKRKQSDTSNASINNNKKIHNYFKSTDRKQSPITPKYKSRTDKHTKMAEFDISQINLEIIASPPGVINEYSRLSFDSNIKRPYNLNNINLSSAKTNMSYSSYHSNISQFSFGPKRSESDYSVTYDSYSNMVNSTASTLKRGINSKLASHANSFISNQKITINKAVNSTTHKKKKLKKSTLIEKLSKRVNLKKEDNYRDQKLFENNIKLNPLREIISKKFYFDKHKENEEININNKPKNQDIIKTPVKNKHEFIGHKRISPLMTRSAYRKSHSRKSSMTEDEVIEFCTPITNRTNNIILRPSPTKNLTNLFKQIKKD